ncbi:MAG: cation:proton antiporter [Nitrospirae bacterium]|nr:cation:proton antiporter [Nitrospirota bacterium]
METEFLTALVLMLGVSALSVFLLGRLRIPSLIGFIVAGALIGPHGLGIIGDIRNVEILADIGIILLLFTVGIEFSIRNLLKMRRAVIYGGGSQVLLSIMASTVAVYAFTGDLGKSIFAGFLIALSSTAIVLKLLLERGEMDSPHGRMMVGILIFQDLCVVPFMLLIPFLTGSRIDMLTIGLTMLKAGVIITLVLISAKWIVPKVLHQVVHTRGRELFTITIIFLCLGIALLTSKFGLSLALGAFLAGLIISESEYSYQATSEILPFKNSFLGIFFVSVGMLIDTGYIGDNLLKIIVAVLVIFGIKALTTIASMLSIGNTPRASLHIGIGLMQIGAFSFVLAVAGKEVGLIQQDTYQMFLSASVITMALAPLLLKSAPDVSAWLTAKKPLKRLSRLRKEEIFPKGRSNHVIIIGFGLNGRNLANVLRKTDIPYVILELNSDTVGEEKKKGQPIYFGDGTQKEILEKLGIKEAKVLVVAISDPVSTRNIVAVAKKENPRIHIVVRTRYLSEVDDLRSLGTEEVIPEEFETSVEIFSRVLHHYRLPINVITEHTEDIRKDSYRALRTTELPKRHLTERHDMLSEIETETYIIKEDSHLSGHSLKELQMRTKTGCTILAIQRGDIVHQNPRPDFALKKQDIILLVGKKEDIQRAITYMESDKMLTLKYH